MDIWGELLIGGIWGKCTRDLSSLFLTTLHEVIIISIKFFFENTFNGNVC